MPAVDTNAPVEVEVNVTTEAPTIDVQIDGYLRSEMFVVDIRYKFVPSSAGGFNQGTFGWEFSATATEITDAAAHGKKIVGHRITDSNGALLNGYTECQFDGIGYFPPVSAAFEEITSTGITYYTVSGDSNVATVNTVPFSTEGGTLLVTFTHNGERWVADKTFAEVTAAIADGAYVYATDTAAFYTLTECDPRPNDGAVTFVAAGDPILGITLWHDEDVDTFGASFATQTWVQSQGYLKQHQSLADYQTKSITDTGGYFTVDTVDDALQEIGAALASKGTYSKPAGGIPASDLASAVQTSLGKADTAVQTETDPTVPSWAKSPNKPSYSYSEITGTPTLAAVATSGSYSDLSNTPTIPSLTGYQTEAITDTGGYYTTDTVEGALQEIGAELAGINTLIGSGVIT